jgi:hypothetical protein
MSGRPKDCVGSGADAPENGTGQTKVDGRPLARIGGGDLPTVAVDPKNENVVYTASTVMWRSEDGGANWSAVRGAPGGDDYQKIWINPNDPDILLVVSDLRATTSIQTRPDPCRECLLKATPAQR